SDPRCEPVPALERQAGGAGPQRLGSARGDQLRPGRAHLHRRSGRLDRLPGQAGHRLPEAVQRGEAGRVPGPARRGAEGNRAVRRARPETPLSAQAGGGAAPVRRDRLLQGPQGGGDRAGRDLEAGVRRQGGRAPGGAQVSQGTAAPGEGRGLDARKAAIRSVLADLGALAERAGLPFVARDVRETRLPKLDGERFTVVVLGEFNHGKSTFINALLGAPVLPTGITPTTAVLSHVTHGARATATLVGEDGTRKTIAGSALGDWLTVDGLAGQSGKAGQDGKKS